MSAMQMIDVPTFTCICNYKVLALEVLALQSSLMYVSVKRDT